jgi:hypothetical protein
VWLEVLNTTTEIPTLQQHLLLSLKAIKGKQYDMLAQGLVGLEHPNYCHLFPMNLGDNILKRHRGVLEPRSAISHNLKEKTTKFICI